jgi:hypothetical protein
MNRLLFVLCCLLGLTFANCRKTKGPASVPSVQPNNGVDSLINMSALVNTRQWQTDSAYSYKVKNSANDSTVINLLIVATQWGPSDTSTITININNYTGPATYNVNPPINAIYYYARNVRHIATSGSFKVESDTGQLLRGTFSFVADSIKVTNGSYKVALP